jgi:PAS domain S-box-containing protein
MSTKILIVEDEQIVARNIEKRLIASGYRVVASAVTGEEAIEKVRSFSPDIVLMDIKLKGKMDGVEAADFIRKNYHLPIIFLTSYTDEETFQRAKITEPFGYLIKPFDIKELNRTVEIALYKNKIYKELNDTKMRSDIAIKAGKTGVWEFWPNKKKYYGDKNLKALYGFNEDELSEDLPAWSALVHIDDRELMSKTFGDFIKSSKHEFKLEHRIYRKDGSIGWVVDYGLLIDEDNEKPLRMIGTTTDITERKEAELELEKSQEQLLKYAEELKKLNASKDKFFSIISHDLRSPFNSLLGVTEFITQSFDEMSTAEIKEAVTNINQSSQQVYNLILNLLEWSRIQTGRLYIEKSELNLSELIENVINLYQQNAGAKEIKLRFNSSEKLIAYADKYMIETVIRNLVSNAIKFTPKGGKVEVNSVKKENFVEVTITDNGLGISKENQRKLFRIDQQFKTEGTANEKGTGLGLILCKEFIEKNDGTINLKSEEGKGSKFIFTIPLLH